MPTLNERERAKAKVAAEIAATSNVGAILQILKDNYKIEEVNLNPLHKMIFVTGLNTIINNLNPPIR